MQDQQKTPHEPDSHNRFQDMIMMANDGIMVIQEDKLALVNPALLLMLGYENTDTLVGEPVDTILDVTTAHFYEEGQEGLHWGDLQNPSFRACLLMKNGSIINVEISTSYFAYEGLPATLGIVRDITSQIELEEAIDLSESRYRTLFDSSPIAYFTLSMSGNILRINRAAERLLGHSEDNILRRNLATFIFGENKNELVRQVVSEVAQGICGYVRIGNLGVLPDDESHTSSGMSSESRRAGECDRTGAYAVCAVCESKAGMERPSVGESLLFHGA